MYRAPSHNSSYNSYNSAASADATDVLPSSRDTSDLDALQLSRPSWRRLVAPAGAPPEAEDDALGNVTPVLWQQVRRLIDTRLTERQRQVLELYFLRGLDQAAVATLLGVTQQSVSEHLFGKLRHGRQVGGLVRKLRKLCARAGISPGHRCADPATCTDGDDGLADETE
jgi:DNA-directed RNA polymerase specialized sigma24 family protein